MRIEKPEIIEGGFYEDLRGKIQIDNFENPSKDLKAEHIILKANDSKILTLPPGYANGLNSLEPDSQIMVYSDYLINESLDDKYRFDKDLWFNWNQFIRKSEPK